jgi:hypothetical protein
MSGDAWLDYMPVESGKQSCALGDNETPSRKDAKTWWASLKGLWYKTRL